MRRRKRQADFRPIEEVAASAGALLPRRDRGRHLAALAAWRAAVGERVQRRTRVATVADDCMTVEVPDAAWGDSLRKLHGEILGKVRRTLGEAAPRRIEFRVAPGVWRPAQRPRPGGRPAAPAPPAPQPAAPPPAAAGPDEPAPPPPPQAPSDDDLQRRLKRVAGRYLARAAGNRRSSQR